MLVITAPFVLNGPNNLQLLLVEVKDETLFRRCQARDLNLDAKHMRPTVLSVNQKVESN